MLRKSIKNITQGNLFCAVELSFLNKAKQNNVLCLKKQKNEFVISKNEVYLESDNLFNSIKKYQHLLLIINNEQVLTKFVLGKIESQKAVQTAFPNLNSNEFYYETYQNEEGTFISICRKTYINDIIKQYEKASLNVVSFSLGNLIVSQVIPFIDESEFYTNNALISIKNEEVENIAEISDVQEQLYIINDLKIKNSSVLCLAGILSYYTKQSKTLKNFDDKIIYLQNNFFQKRIFEIGLKTGLILVFILLLFNFLIFSNYNSKINIIKSEIEVNKSYKENLLSLKEEVGKKKKIVNGISSTSSFKVSQYMDKIGLSIPNTILLNQINYQPLKRNIKKGDEILYVQKIILVNGKSSNGEVFSNWISILEQEKWIQSIILVNYGFGKKKSTEFQLKIIL